MEFSRLRRSCRLPLTIPIRVYGTDFKGSDFSEDSTTVVVNRHGAKIRLIRQLLPEQEIRLFSRPTRKEALFRVVSQAPGAEGDYTFWGLECLEPEREIWGIPFPKSPPERRFMIRLKVECPVCMTREPLDVDESMLEVLQSLKGLPRDCLACGTTSLWTLVQPDRAQA